MDQDHQDFKRKSEILAMLDDGKTTVKIFDKFDSIFWLAVKKGIRKFEELTPSDHKNTVC